MRPEDFVGMTLQAAINIANANFDKHRIVSKDGKPFIITCDYDISRINFATFDNIVIEAFLG